MSGLRMSRSCQGCRVLRKGCKEECVLRDCIQWLPNPQSQANATMFLVKFYGRTGFANLIEPVHPTMRPELCKSLLLEACGRIIDPIYGSLGMISLGNWATCLAAVERVLQGLPIMQFSVSNQGVSAHPVMPLQGSDIRHIPRDKNATPRPRNNKRCNKSEIRVAKASIKHGIRGCKSADNPKDREFEVGSSSENHDGLLELTLAKLPPSRVI